MMRSNAKVEKVYLYPKPVDFRKSIDGLAELVELDSDDTPACLTNELASSAHVVPSYLMIDERRTIDPPSAGRWFLIR